jgi:eukaryotic translation initiation factor 2C
MGITAPAPVPGSRIRLDGPDDPQIENQLKALAGHPTRAKVVLVILPIAHRQLYNRIKHAGDVKVGVHTVCVVGSKFAKGQLQYFANVATKFNLKLGGINQLLDNTRLGIISEDKTMVIGLDVTHPSPGSLSSAPSIAGMVASIDRWLGQWPATIRIQESRKEMITDLTSMLARHLDLWKKRGKHASYPENLLIYRDGVSEGQYDTVLEDELPLLRKACSNLYPPPDTKRNLPHITIIIVGKRHHTRFYPTTADSADRSANPKSGTVVDRAVTEPRNWDFFLQAHSALQGTARPAHYYIVLDEIFRARKVPPQFGNTADVLEDLTHCMCYLFGRATKAVSICPPAYYADLVCERARCYLSHVFEGSSAQSVSSGGGGDLQAMLADVMIHPNIRDDMWYM